MLILICTGMAFSCVEEAKTEKHPNGDARQAIVNLYAKYQVETPAAKVELKREFTCCKMKSGTTDPDAWFMELEYIRQRLKGVNAPVSDEDVIAHVLCNIDEKYSELVTTLEGDFENLNLTKLCERIRGFYRRRIAVENENEVNESLALYGNKQFKGRCNLCGKIGHKSAKCREKVEKKKKMSNLGSNLKPYKNKKIICYYCQKPGHMSNRCFARMREEKQKKTVENEQTRAKSNDNIMALVTSAIDAKDIKKAMNTNFWVADSGASNHMTNTVHGLVNCTRLF
jgi:hypothetical protein